MNKDLTENSCHSNRNTTATEISGQTVDLFRSLLCHYVNGLFSLRNAAMATWKGEEALFHLNVIISDTIQIRRRRFYLRALVFRQQQQRLIKIAKYFSMKAYQKVCMKHLLPLLVYEIKCFKSL